MTIATRPDWNGNAPVHTFDEIGPALEFMKENPCYEILPESAPVRPYGDIDFKVGDEVTEAEFHALDFAVFSAIAEFFAGIDRAVTQFSASSWAYRKISHRWVVPDAYVKTVAHAKAFAADLYSRITLPAGAVGDMSVYSKSRKMRTLWTSKPNEDRPFTMLQGEEADHIISYVPKWATLLDFDLEEPSSDPKPICSEYEATYLTKLCDCISVASWTDYTTAQSLIFSLLSVGASPDLLHRVCSKAPNYSWKWVNDYIKRYTPSKNKHSIGTLKFFARRDNPEAYGALGRDPVTAKQMGKTMFEDMTRLTTDETTRHDWCDAKGFLKALPVVPTLAVKSHLGTGKTRRCIEACTPAPEVEVVTTVQETYVPGDASQRTLTGGVVEGRTETKVVTKTVTHAVAQTVLVLSCRQTFTTHICAELKGFVDYRTIKGPVIDSDRVVCQVQSLWKCKAMAPRDLLLIDEVESILANLTPNKTHKHYLETAQAFETLVRTAKRVIVLDAFLTDRSVEMLKTLRGHCDIVINPTLPYTRTADVVEESALYSSIRSSLKDGKRLVAIWGAKSKAKSFHSMVPAGVAQVLYTGDSDAKIKDQHLADVDTHWARHQLVGYTATITVGVNYNGPSFDQACVYATPWSCPSRDYIQALHRARTLTDNHMTVYINTSPRPCSFEAGIDEQERQFKETTDRVKKFLQDIGQCPTDYAVLPPWLHRVLMWNINETITNYKHFEECMRGYLTLCGVQMGATPESNDPVSTAKDTTMVRVEEVADIDFEVAQVYSRNRQTLSDVQRYELEKFYMKQKVETVDNFIWSAWLTTPKQVQRSWSVFNLTPDKLISEKVIDLVPRDAERLHLFQSLKVDWDSAWQTPVAEVPTIDLTVFGQRVRSEKNTSEQYCRDLSKALKQWCGVETKVDRKRVRKDTGLEYTYTLSYEPQGQVFSYVTRPLTAGQVFAGVE
jgi:hypothetical protein